MKEIKELNPRNHPTDPAIEANLAILFERLLLLQEAYGKELQITSGLRSAVQQLDLIKQGKTKATKSKHLTGEAADVLDRDCELAMWVKWNVKIIEKIGLWIEEPNCTRGWVHFQIVPPKSKRRFFHP